jgi:hypothetical protein
MTKLPVKSEAMEKELGIVDHIIQDPGAYPPYLRTAVKRLQAAREKELGLERTMQQLATQIAQANNRLRHMDLELENTRGKRQGLEELFQDPDLLKYDLVEPRSEEAEEGKRYEDAPSAEQPARGEVTAA